MKKHLLLLCMSAVLLFASPRLPEEKSIKEGVLDNGFRYSLVFNPKPSKRAEIRLYVNAGSLDEADDQRGLAHFVEHMAFNGIKHFKKNELISYLESVGMVFGGDLNANTSEERTLYILSVPLERDNLEKAMTIVRDWADGLNFNPKEYDKERKIILEERRLRDTVQKRLLDQYRVLFYGNSRYLLRDPIGSVDVIKESPVARAKAFYDTWYRPEAMHLVVVGDINTSRTEQMIRKKMASIQSKRSQQQVARVAQDVNETRILSVTDNALTQNSVSLLFTENIPPMQTVEGKKQALEHTIILMLFNLRAQEQLLHKDPKALQMQMFMEQVSKNRWVYEFAATYRNGNGLEALGELYGLMSSFNRYGFSKENFALAKKLILAKVEKTHARLRDRQSKEIADVLVQTIENNATYIDYDYDYTLTKKLLETMQLAAINKAYRKILGIQNRAVLFKDSEGKNFDTPHVLDVLQHAKQDAKDLSQVKKTASHILEKPLVPVKIVSKTFNKEAGVYHYLLENNISIDFHPNSHNKNLLLLQAFSEGGYSILKGEKLKTAKHATEVVMQSAPGKWNDIELQKIMTGKQAKADVSIERFGEKVNASCNTKDMETMFALLYARITQPKVDERVLKNIKQILASNIRQAEHTPQYRFDKEIIKHYYGNNPEIKPLSAKEIETLDASAILALYKERFADMNHFHFVISGDANPKQIERHIATYLGNLPVQQRREGHGTVPYAHPKGKVEITRDYNTENRANVTIQYIGKVPFSIENNLRAMIAANILSIRLRNLIREEKSGVYDIQVAAELTEELKDEAVTTITFVCDPKRKEELLSAIDSAIAAFVKKGVTSEEMHAVKKMILLAYRNRVDRNGFWVDGMMASYRFHTPIETLVTFPKIIAGIQAASVQKIAKALFAGDRLTATLMPHR